MNIGYFNDFDHTQLWDDSEYSLSNYVGDPPLDDLIREIEDELGYTLPNSYVELMKLHNGGRLADEKCCFPCSEGTWWSSDHAGVSGIYGIGRDKPYSLCGDMGSQFMIGEWEYPDIGVCLCDCPSGHDLIMLDYTKCGKHGEPEVVHIEQQDNYKKTFLAKDFETFIRGLVGKDVYDTSDLDLEMDLSAIKSGRFSDIMQEFFKARPEIDYESGLRNLFTEITNSKGHFSLHDDELSLLAYDVQFLLFSRCKGVPDRAAYPEAYPGMIAMANAAVSTKGYAPCFIEEWMQNRLNGGQIAKSSDGSLEFTTQWTETVMQKLSRFLQVSAS